MLAILALIGILLGIVGSVWLYGTAPVSNTTVDLSNSQVVVPSAEVVE